MSRNVSTAFLVVFLFLGTGTSYFLWDRFNEAVWLQIIAILLIAFVGEHIVSGQGYYYYNTSQNSFFVGRVPLWIPFMWVFIIQASLLSALFLGFSGIFAAIGSGILAMLGDLILIEPFLCRIQQLWRWQPVKNGYFSFIPQTLYRFTAPIGNYITWFFFPFLMNLVLELLSFLFT